LTCPVCGKESAIAKCENCGFETPAFGFLSEEDAGKWFQDTVLPHRELYQARSELQRTQNELNEVRSEQQRLLSELNKARSELQRARSEPRRRRRKRRKIGKGLSRLFTWIEFNKEEIAATVFFGIIGAGIGALLGALIGVISGAGAGFVAIIAAIVGFILGLLITVM